MPEPDPFARLPREERERIGRFVGRVERLPLETLLTLAAEPLDEAAHARAARRAAVVAADTLRTPAVGRTRADALAWVDRAFGQVTLEPGRRSLSLGPPGSPRDRARFANALAEALAALVLWDRLDEADRDELLGPFAALLEEPGSRS